MDISDFTLSPLPHDESEKIAAVLCPYLASASPKTPYRWRDDRVAEYEEVYRLLQTFGGRKGFLESKRDFVIRSILPSPCWFKIASGFIELSGISPDGTATFWTGAGQIKEKGKYCGPKAFVQIHIIGIFDEIYPFLEKLDPKEREADRLRRRQSSLDNIPKYVGPPGDPKIAAETQRILDEIRGIKREKESDF